MPDRSRQQDLTALIQPTLRAGRALEGPNEPRRKPKGQRHGRLPGPSEIELSRLTIGSTGVAQ